MTPSSPARTSDSSKMAADAITKEDVSSREIEYSAEEEKKLVRKIDLFLLPTIWIVYLLSYMVSSRHTQLQFLGTDGRRMPGSLQPGQRSDCRHGRGVGDHGPIVLSRRGLVPGGIRDCRGPIEHDTCEMAAIAVHPVHYGILGSSLRTGRPGPDVAAACGHPHRSRGCRSWFQRKYLRMASCVLHG